LLGLAPNAWVSGIAWLVIGVGMAFGLYEAAFSTLAGIYGRQARKAITGITLLAGLASTLCWPISAFLEAEVGWRWVCFSWACAHIALGLPLNRFLVPLGKQASPPALHSTRGARQSVQPQNRPMALLAFVFVVTWFTSTAMATHLPRLLQETGATPSTAIAAAALVGPAQVAGRLLEFGPLQRWHPLLSARMAALAHPVGAMAIMIFGAPAMLMFPVLHGAGNGILTIAKGTLPLAIFGPSGYGLRQGVLMAPARFGQAGAPFLFGLLIERFGASSLLLSTALGFAALLALLVLSPPSMADQQ
jgi:predicted MFS family arabinose efflux permease